MGSILDYLFVRVANYNLWMVAIELFSIGFVVYWLVDFLEGTRGERLFRGVIFVLLAGVVVLNFIVQQLQVERLQYLYKGFLLSVLIAAVAAFQPEIRRALMRIGKTGFREAKSFQLNALVEQLISASKDLSVAKTGAIIVLEREIALGELIETGVRLNADVSAALLKTIFYPGNPLHDMAVIISGNRILSAHVQLPLAEASREQGFNLGSRHRAAMGITSESDACVVVVSEETGIVSIAHNGRLIRNVTEAQLRKKLMELMAHIS